MHCHNRLEWVQVVILAVFALAIVPDPPAWADQEELSVPGLDQPVEVLRDRWGISHIYARNEHDLFFAQGFVVAGDRLFQLEMWRRQATGTLAEIQGPRALGRDIGARLLQYRGDLTRELNRYHPRGEAIITAFVQGINAYIERTEREPSRLPLEFQALGIKPGRWTPEIVVSRHNGLYRNATQEIQAARLVRVLGEERARELLNLHPGRPRLAPDPAIDLASIRTELLGPYEESRSVLRFRPEDLVAAFRGEVVPKDREVFENGRDRGLLAGPVEVETALDALTAQGSNNWVIAGDHTFSRAPIMANDPHRALLLPSLRYWVHLVAPGWNVIGGGEPALPGVAIGHNERGAWGFTIFPIDQEDLYVYETNPVAPSRYRYRGGWEEMRVVQETIVVKGQPPVAATLKYTRHGPVVFEDHGKQRAYALRAAWLEEGAAPYLASLRLDQAASWEEFQYASRRFLIPSENLVWADVDGHIGWQAVGLVPIRKNWDGLVPVPGDGRYEWDGYQPAQELPHLADPPRGWIATANQDNLPPDFPFAVGFQWTEPFRFSRVEEVLGSGRRFTLSDMMHLQVDELSLPARALVPMLLRVAPGSVRSRHACERLASWDFVLDKDSVPAAIYVAWEKALRSALWDLVVPAEQRKALTDRSVSAETMIRWLTAPDGRFGPEPLAGRNTLLMKILDQALAELERRLGPDINRWHYGQEALKRVQIAHPMLAAVRADLRARLDPGWLARGGSANTVNNTSDSDNQVSGASFRIIADMGDWDRSVGTNTPGQSGDPASPHYRDLFVPWSVGDYFPAFYSRPKVESVTEAKIVLVPSQGSR
jgi:penicillin amidase